MEQELVLSRVFELWPDARLIDRRDEPMHGYRAVHVVPRVDGCFVEIQIRTGLQNVWAQLFEALGDSWGRQIRYGEPPNDPEAPADQVAAGPTSLVTRGEMVAYIRGGLSASIARWEGLVHAATLRGYIVNLMAPTDQPVDELSDDDPVRLALLEPDAAREQDSELLELEAALKPFIDRANEIAPRP